MPGEPGPTTCRPSRWLGLLLLLLFTSCPSLAAFQPPIRSQPVARGVQVLVSHRVVATVRTGEGGLLPLDRAERLVWSLRQFLEEGGSGWQLRAAPYGNSSWAVYGGETALIVVTPREAAAHRSTPRSLARTWVRALRSTLALPPLTLSRLEVIVPYNERRTVTVGGVAAGELTATVFNPEIVDATPLSRPRSLVLRGLAPGLTAVRVEAEGASITLSVRVMKYAASLSSSPVAEVTGNPAPAELVREAAAASYMEGLRVEPGARVRLSGPLVVTGPSGPTSVRPLLPGQTAWIHFPISVTGPEYLPFQGKVRVQVRNRRLPPRETQALLYSNNPERVSEPRVLFLGRLEPDAPARLLYHHENASGEPLRLNIDVYNPGGQEARLHIIEGTAGPAPDPVGTGHRAGVRYLRAALREVGRIVVVPPGARRSLLLVNLPNARTASGLFSLRVLTEERLLVRVAAEAPDSPPGSLLADARQLSPEVFPSPRKEIEALYRVGERWAFVNVGRQPIEGDGDRRLFGNYGVLYDISLFLENPLEEEKTVRLVLSPNAGGARGVFVIDDQIVEAPFARPPEEVALARLTLKPSERRTLKIRAMPVGGSAYPVSLVVRP